MLKRDFIILWLQLYAYRTLLKILRYVEPSFVAIATTIRWCLFRARIIGMRFYHFMVVIVAALEDGSTWRKNFNGVVTLTFTKFYISLEITKKEHVKMSV